MIRIYGMNKQVSAMAIDFTGYTIKKELFDNYHLT